MTNYNKKTILVYCNDKDVAKQIKIKLEDDFKNIYYAINVENYIEKFEEIQPNLIVLAYPSLAENIKIYLILYRTSKIIINHKHFAIILCNASDATEASTLCSMKIFEDYIIFWPEYDKSRFKTSVTNILTSAITSTTTTSDSPQETIPSNEKSIMILDDDEMYLAVISSILSKTGYSLSTCDDPQKALKLIPNNPPDLLLIDYEMPKYNGLAVLEKLTKIEKLSNMKIIMLTGHSDKKIIQQALKFKIDDFIVKPSNKETILNKISKFL